MRISYYAGKERKMRVVMAIIDGTGEWSDRKYAADMMHSFCKQLDNALAASCFYQRGPSNDGFSVRHKAKMAAHWLIKAHKADPRTKLCLAGYSRGGSAAVYAAEFLNDAGKIPVDSLFLFDAVARHIWAGGEVIPANVAFVRHAVRSHDPAFIAKYEGTINSGVGNPARPWFGNTAMQSTTAGNYHYRTFLGSHGALGGVGWKHVTEDPACQIAVANWMNGCMAMRGVPGVLRSFPP